MTAPGKQPGASRDDGPGHRPARAAVVLVLWLACQAGAIAPASDLDLVDAEKLYRTGQYDECAKLAGEETAKGYWSEPWAHWRIKAELARGKGPAALAAYEAAVRRFPSSVTLHLLGRDVHRANGRDAAATAEMETVERLILGGPQRYATPAGRLALGRFFLLRGADARKVLDQFYDVVIKDVPDYVDAYLATAELALEKQDDALAAQTPVKAPKDAAEDPRFHYLLARALSDEDRAGSARALAEALKINPKHVDSLLLQADHRIDSEKYDEAGEILARDLEVNPVEPRAWAYRAVLAHLRNDPG